jgi:hypothetical protein
MTSPLLKLDWSLLPLGKAPFQIDTRDLKLSNYIDKNKLINSAQCPLAHDWDTVPTPSGQLPKEDDDPLGNDNAKCCVFSAPGHMVKMIGQQTGEPIIVTKQMVLDAYSITGYKLDPKIFDNGFNIRVLLKLWKLFQLYGTKALAYVAVNWNDPDEVALASWLGCGVLGGFMLPNASQGQVDKLGRQLWSVPMGGFPAGQGPGTWGRHCIWCHSPSSLVVGGNSWGRKVYWTTPWQQQCCEEMWMVLVDRWKMATGRAPNGFAFDDLLADAAVRAAA